MVVVPEVTPVTLPEPSTVAMDVLVLLQLPLEAPSVNEIDELTHNVAVPLIVPATGSGLTVTTCVAAAVLQLFVTE